MINPLKDIKFYTLWLASIFGAISVLPYASTISGIVISPSLVVITIIQVAFLYAFILFFGIKISQKLNFRIIPSNSFFIPSIISGLSVGFAIKLLNKFVFSTKSNLLLKNVTDVASWKGILASFYGAINEEILLRLFAVSLLVLILQRFSRIKKPHCIVISIVFCALLFGLGHLPMLYKILETPNSWDLFRVISLNSIAGIVFGLLYWRYGLISSMLSHFIADLLIHVFF